MLNLFVITSFNYYSEWKGKSTFKMDFHVYFDVNQQKQWNSEYTHWVRVFNFCTLLNLHPFIGTMNKRDLINLSLLYVNYTYKNQSFYKGLMVKSKLLRRSKKLFPWKLGCIERFSLFLYNRMVDFTKRCLQFFFQFHVSRPMVEIFL